MIQIKSDEELKDVQVVLTIKTGAPPAWRILWLSEDHKTVLFRWPEKESAKGQYYDLKPNEIRAWLQEHNIATPFESVAKAMYTIAMLLNLPTHRPGP